MTPRTFRPAIENAKQKITKAALNDVSSKVTKKGKEEKREAQNTANRICRYGKTYFDFITTPCANITHTFYLNKSIYEIGSIT